MPTYFDTERTFILSLTNHYKHCQLVYVDRNCVDNIENCGHDAVAEEAFLSLDMDVMKKNNLRPISNLSVISKLTENVVLSRLNDHISSSKLHEKFRAVSQYGNCAGENPE